MFDGEIKCGSSEIQSSLEALETGLGDPWQADAPVSYASLMKYDEAAAYPVQDYDALVGQDIHKRLIPEHFGGHLYSCHESLYYFRTLSRRCTTLATVALLPNIGYFAVLIAGTEEQKAKYAEVLKSGESICWGLSELKYGSDVMSNRTTAIQEGDDYRISGAKWPIGLADRSRFMVVQGRTDEGASPMAHTLLIFDRAGADRASWNVIPNEPLYGVRGLPLGGVNYDNALVKGENRLGDEGRSLEVILRTHQILRIGVSSTTLGAADTGLRIALGFARERTLFGDPIVNLPVTRRQLADVFADLLLGDILLGAAARSLHVAPKRLYLQCSLVKYFIPTVMEDAMRELSVLIGARYFLRDNFAKGIFQKMLRDGAMASFVDGNTLVNLRIIGSQIPLALKKIMEARKSGLTDKQAKAVANLFNFNAPVGKPEWTKLDLQNNGEDLNLIALRNSIERLEGRASTRAVSLARALETQIDRLALDYEAVRDTHGKDYMQSAAFYDIAGRYCLLSAGAAAVSFAAHARDMVPAQLGNADWLAYGLLRILRKFDPLQSAPEVEEIDEMVEALNTLYEQNRAFAMIPYAYAGKMTPLSEMGELHV